MSKVTDAEFLRQLANDLIERLAWTDDAARLQNIAEKLDVLEPKTITERCLCACPRCGLFPTAHDVTHVDCCGKQAKMTSEEAESAFYEHQTTCQGCAAMGTGEGKLCPIGANLLQVVGLKMGTAP